MNALLEPLLKSTRLPELASELLEVVQREREKRGKFLEELTPEMKAEFILGEVILHSPAKAKHLDVTLDMAYRLKDWVMKSGGGRAFVEKCLVSLSRNDFEPDIVWFSEEKAREFTPDQMRFPAPDLVVEVLSPSTEERDRGVKFEDYAIHGVSEYWIVDPDARTIEQYILPEGGSSYSLHEKLAHGTVRSMAAAGFEVALDDVFGSAG